MRPPSPGRPRRPPLGPFVAAAAAAALLVGLAGRLPPRPGEGPLARWLRMVAEHPVRGAAALGLVLWALRRPPPPPDGPDDAGLGPGEVL